QQAERLKYVFDTPRIVLVLRNPIDWLISNYKYCVEHEGFHLPLAQYLDFGERRTPFALEKRAPFYIPDFFYSEVVARYRDVFGADRVLVLRYEDFVKDAAAYGETLARFMGLPLPEFATRSSKKVLESVGDAQVETIRLENMAA